MPKPRGKASKKVEAISEVAKGAELDAKVLANGLIEEVGDAISKPDALVENDVAKEEEAPEKATNARGRGKKADNKLAKEEVQMKKAVVAAPKGKGRGKKTEDVEVIAKDVEVIAQDVKENAQSNGDASVPASVEEKQEDAGTISKVTGGRGKRGAKAAVVKESAIENEQTKENGKAESVAEIENVKPEVVVVTKTTKGRGGKKAVKDTVEDLKEVETEENIKTQEPETKVPARKTAGRKKKVDDKAVPETDIEKEDISAKSTFDLLKEEHESLKVNDNTKEVISEQDTTNVAETAEAKSAAKKTSGRKKKVDDNASTETDLEKGSDGKSLFDLLKEESEAEKDNEENQKEPTIEEDTTNAQEPETQVVAKKTAGRKKKVIENETDINAVTVLPINEEDEPPKKKGRVGRKPAAVNTAEEANSKVDEVENKENAEVSKRPAKRGAKAEEPIKAQVPDVEKRSLKRGAKAQETPRIEEGVEVENKPTRRGRGAVAKTTTKAEEITDDIATDEAAPKKRSRKEPSVEKELKLEDEKPKKGRPAAGKRKVENVEEKVAKQAHPEEDNSKVNAPAEATEDASTKKTQKAAATNRGGRKRAAPSSTNKSKTDADEDKDKSGSAAAAEAIAVEDAEADGSKSSKAKKKKKESQMTTAAAPMNATIAKYNKEDFQLAPLADGQTADEPRFNLKISSWNVAGLRAWLKKEGLQFFDYEEPDILCFQETKCTTEQLPEEVTRIPGYHPYWLCMPGGYAGVAIYSKIMPINVEYGIGSSEFDDVGRVITAEYEKFFLINVYVPNSGRKLVNLESRMKWEKLFQEFVQKFDDHKPVVICGDMNVSHQEIDLANPKSNTRNAGFTKEERDKMSELLALGYVDTFRHLYPERKGAYTFWTYMGNARARNVGWRLDYFIVSERFTKRVVDNCMRTQCLGSDHCPITLFLKL